MSSTKEPKKHKHKKQHAEAEPEAAGEPPRSSKKHKKHRHSDAGAEQPSPAAAAAAAASSPADGAAPSSKKKHKKHKHKQEDQAEQQQPAAAGAAQPSEQQQPSTTTKKRKHKEQQDEQQQQQPEQEPSSKKKKHKATPAAAAAAAAAPHTTLTIQVPSKGKAGGGAATPKQQAEQQQRTAAAAGPWLVYMAAPDPSVYSKLQFKAYAPRQQQGSSSDKGLVLVSEEQGGTTLVGSTKSTIAEPTSQFSSYAVGVYDKQTNTLQLMKPAGGKVVRMEALAANAGPVELAAFSKPTGHGEVAASTQPAGEKDLAARREEVNRLVGAFGSTRRRRQLQQRADGAVVVTQNASAGELDVLMTEVQQRAAAAGDTREEIMQRMSANRVVPVHNPLATTPAEAYQVQAMFGSALLSSLNSGQLLHAADKAEDFNKLRDKHSVPAYVLSRVQRITDAGSNAGEKKRRAKLLALLSALIRLAVARDVLRVRAAQEAVPADEEGKGGRPARPGGVEGLANQLRIWRADVLQALLDKFYDKRIEDGQPTFVLDVRARGLLLMHLLVVALDVEGWRMAPAQFEDLRRELNMTPADVVARYRELGCTASSVRLQVDEGESVAAYAVTLLPSGDKTLAQAFPKPKIARKQAGR